MRLRQRWIVMTDDAVELPTGRFQLLSLPNILPLTSALVLSEEWFGDFSPTNDRVYTVASDYNRSISTPERFGVGDRAKHAFDDRTTGVTSSTTKFPLLMQVNRCAVQHIPTG
jgi:hypothetical protein